MNKARISLAGVKKMLARIVIYSLGLLCLSFGVAFSINSNLGVSPVNSLPYIISEILKLDMGFCVIGIFILYIFLQYIILKKDFHIKLLLQVVFSGVFGYFVDFAKKVVGDFVIPGYGGRLLLLSLSIVCVAIGVVLYLGVELVSMPMEGLVKAVADKLLPKKKFHTVKILMDCFVVFIGGVLSVLFLGRVEGIREGTVLCALLVGFMIHPIQKILYPSLKKICF